MSAYVPQHYLPIEDLALKRGIDPEKLAKGLGLQAMALPDVYEDTATMAATAVLELMQRNQISPLELGRLYLGTESALDGAKPTATYAHEMLRRYFRDEYGPDCLTRCDVIDMTFACVGGVDALLNTLDWVRAGTQRVGIVVASDFAKYELASTGEYTQGAGAIAVLVRENPRLLSLQGTIGVATRGVHDFFKPIRQVRRAAIVGEALLLAEVAADPEDVLAKADSNDEGDKNYEQRGVLDANDDAIGIHTVTPTFDGPYSNWTYQRRIREAYDHYVEQVAQPLDEQPIFTWARVIMHLPYAAHGRRMLMDLFVRELQRQGIWDDVAAASKLAAAPTREEIPNEQAFDDAWEKYLRLVGKTDAYRSFAEQQLRGSSDASGLVGNLYAGSIFLALMSTLAVAAQTGESLAGKTLGFISYGSGSKSKVFAGAMRGRWEEQVRSWRLFERLSARTAVGYDTYERLHRGLLSEPLAVPQGRFGLDHISEEVNKVGARYYRWYPE